MFALRRNVRRNAPKAFCGNISGVRSRPKSTRRFEIATVQKDKAESLIGFAVKAGHVLYGIDTVEAARKKLYLIVLCDTVAENTRKKALSVAAAKHVPVIVSRNELQYTVGRKNCKVLAVTDRQMAEAIVTLHGENYHIISEVK